MRSVLNLLLYLSALAPLAIEPVAARRDNQDQQHVLLPPAPVIESPHQSSPHPLSGQHDFVSIIFLA